MVPRRQEFGHLAEEIAASDVVLLFLSRGYFASKACAIEYEAAVRLGKPLILVHEGNENKGGLPLEQARRDCPEPLREAVFSGRPIVSWQRSDAFQQIALKRIVAEVLVACGCDLPRSVARRNLHATAPADGGIAAPSAGPAGFEDGLKPETWLSGTAGLFARLSLPTVSAVRGEKVDHGAISLGSDALYLHKEARLVPKLRAGPLTLAFSRHNHGAREIALEIASLVAGCSAAEWPLSDPPAGRVVPLLLLDASTFGGDSGERLAGEVRQWCAQRATTPLLLHAALAEDGGCPFEEVMQRTPTDLVHAKLYSQIALPWFQQPDFRKAALVALSQELDQRKAA
uniref:TIR domain-containing protein n=1 Tax=Emiliania huxleyi TaxID=2903 RepID=A0A7S3T1A3_EMIHU|mmetsp:Transcript_30611/g.90903  ORF Transcript_30611/g.90903 Transcript_30611/m.90903 type:complete len:343 (-) Transcript_30611:104-1132(-)